jgi:agmatinase
VRKRGVDIGKKSRANFFASQPAYDTNAEHTTMAAADALYEIMSIMVKRGPLSFADGDSEEL